MKTIVAHNRHTNEPIIIKISAINAIEKVIDEYGEEYAEIIINDIFLCVKESIDTVMQKIRDVEKGGGE